MLHVELSFSRNSQATEDQEELFALNTRLYFVFVSTGNADASYQSKLEVRLANEWPSKLSPTFDLVPCGWYPV